MKSKRKNGLEVDALRLTTIAPDSQTVKLFKVLYEKMRAINKVFDPLKLFHDEEYWEGSHIIIANIFSDLNVMKLCIFLLFVMASIITSVPPDLYVLLDSWFLRKYK